MNLRAYFFYNRIELSHLINRNYLMRASPRSTLSLARARRRRISITAGEESEANVTCGFTARKQNVLEEGEHKQAVKMSHMFALFEDDCLR